MEIVGYNSEIHLSGPFFNGQAEALMGAATVAARYALAERGEALVKQIFTDRIRDNHGIFIASITAIDATRFMEWAGRTGKLYTMPVVVSDPMRESIVTTENAMYGPWLEGVGSRNLTTRFKGYWGFREATRILEAEADAIVEEAIVPYVAAMEG
jgi:hypothetical protein